MSKASHPGPERAACWHGSECPWHSRGRCLFRHEEPAPATEGAGTRAQCRNGTGCPWNRQGRCYFLHEAREAAESEPRETASSESARCLALEAENHRLRKRVARIERDNELTQQKLDGLRDVIVVLRQVVLGRCSTSGSSFDHVSEDYYI